MEEIFGRFPGLGKQILNEIDSKTLAKCRKVNVKWKNYIDQEKTIWVRMIEKHIGIVNMTQDWKMLMFKASTNIVIELAIAVCQFYQSDPPRVNEKKW